MPRTFLDDIIALDHAVYQEVIHEYVGAVSRLAGVLWIGQFGSTISPGISDIDLLVVCDDDCYESVNLQARGLARRSDLHRYLFYHSGYVVPLSAVRNLKFTHSLENLRTVAGDPSMLERFADPDPLAAICRVVLWNSSIWSRLLSYCARDEMSVRLVSIFVRNVRRSARNNYEISGRDDDAKTVFAGNDQERGRILEVGGALRIDMARQSLRAATRALVESDGVLCGWFRKKGLVAGRVKSTKLQLSPHSIVIFDSGWESASGPRHLHRGTRHITYLPAFYHELCRLIARPYVRAQPALGRVWNSRHSANLERRMYDACWEWGDVVLEQFRLLRAAGASHMTCNVYPFDIAGSGSLLRRYGAGLKRMLGAGNGPSGGKSTTASTPFSSSQ